MSFEIHLSVHPRYLDSSIGDCFQSKIKHFFCDVTSNIHYLFMMAVKCSLLFTCLYISDI